MHSIWAARIFHFLHERKGKQPKSCIIRQQMHATVIVIIPRACWKDPYDFTSRDVLIVFRINVLHQIRRQRSGHRKTRTRNVSEGGFFFLFATPANTPFEGCVTYTKLPQPVSPSALGVLETTRRQQLPILFSPFSRSPSTARAPSNSGRTVFSFLTLESPNERV